MTTKTKTKEEFWADLEAIGEKEVRERVAKRVYRDLEQQDLWSREWLLRRDFNREFAFEQPKIVAEIELSKAMRAAYAKERGVIEATLKAAKAAERQATIATRIAVAALLVGIVTLVFSVFLDLK